MAACPVWGGLQGFERIRLAAVLLGWVVIWRRHDGGLGGLTVQVPVSLESGAPRPRCCEV